MPSIESGYSSATVSTADSDDKFIISVDGAVKTISTTELRKLMSKSEEVEVSATTYTLLASDQTKVVRATHADAKTFTIPATSGFVIGVPIVIRNASATDITIQAASGVTINTSTSTIEQNVAFTLIPRATDNWDVYSGGEGGGAVQLSTPTLTMTAASDTAMDFSWTNVANESSYQVQIAEDSGFTTGVQTATPAADDTAHQFTGLTASTTYYGRVKAVGDGVSYSDSAYGTDNEATQAGGGGGPVHLVLSPVQNLTESPTGTWEATDANANGVADTTIAASTEGSIEAVWNSATNDQAVIGLDVAAGLEIYSAMNFALYYAVGTYRAHGVEGHVSLGVAAVAGDRYRIRREAGGTVVAERFQSGGGSWDLLHTYTNTTTAELYGKVDVLVVGNKAADLKGDGFA